MRESTSLAHALTSQPATTRARRPTLSGCRAHRYWGPDRWRWARRLLGPLVGRALFSDEACPPVDVLTELQAELDFDSRAVLPTVRVPVLLVAGTRDRFFPPAVIDETAALIPGSTVVSYRGKDHIGAGTDKRVARDVMAFAGRSGGRQP